MKLMNQQDVYGSVGRKIKSDLYDGNAVVLFAYGLSGSGKTFTVFGPDAVDIPEVCPIFCESMFVLPSLGRALRT